MPTLSYEGIDPRLVAQIIDTVALFVLFLFVGFVLSGSLAFEYQGAAALPFPSVYGLVGILCFAILEGTMGATVGKKLVKIKVVREDGSACGIGPAFVRTLLRIIDGLPFLYIVGMVLIARSDKKQRLGDLLAKTVVVKALRRARRKQRKEEDETRIFWLIIILSKFSDIKSGVSFDTPYNTLRAPCSRYGMWDKQTHIALKSGRDITSGMSYPSCRTLTRAYLTGRKWDKRHPDALRLFCSALCEQSRPPQSLMRLTAPCQRSP